MSPILVSRPCRSLPIGRQSSRDRVPNNVVQPESSVGAAPRRSTLKTIAGIVGIVLLVNTFVGAFCFVIHLIPLLSSGDLSGESYKWATQMDVWILPATAIGFVVASILWLVWEFAIAKFTGAETSGPWSNPWLMIGRWFVPVANLYFVPAGLIRVCSNVRPFILAWWCSIVLFVGLDIWGQAMVLNAEFPPREGVVQLGVALVFAAIFLLTVAYALGWVIVRRATHSVLEERSVSAA